MRRRSKIDDNQPEIVKALRKLGATVAHTHQIGQGFPDILIGYNGNHLAEIKDGSKYPSARKLTPDEQKWHDNWPNKVHIIESLADVEQFIKEYKNGN